MIVDGAPDGLPSLNYGHRGRMHTRRMVRCCSVCEPLHADQWQRLGAELAMTTSPDTIFQDLAIRQAICERTWHYKIGES